MSKTWTFIGDGLAGIVGVFTAAGITLELDTRKGCNCDAGKDKEKLAFFHPLRYLYLFN